MVKKVRKGLNSITDQRRDREKKRDGKRLMGHGKGRFMGGKYREAYTGGYEVGVGKNMGTVNEGRKA